MTSWKKGGKPGGVGKGHFHNIPFIHRTKTDKHRITIAVRSWQLGKWRNRWGDGMSLKKHRPPNWGAWGELGLLQPKNNQKIKSGWGRPEPSGVEGRGRSRGWGAVWQLGEGIALPLLGSPQPLRSGRKGAACNPHGQVWGCQMLRAGGWRGLTKACPPGR